MLLFHKDFLGDVIYVKLIKLVVVVSGIDWIPFSGGGGQELNPSIFFNALPASIYDNSYNK